MRTLSLVEVEQVSGAGTIADVISGLGAGIGTLVEPTKCNPSNGTKPDGNKLTLTSDVLNRPIDPSGTSRPPVNPNPCKPFWWWWCK